MDNNTLWWLAVPVVTSIVAIVFAGYLARWVLAKDTGTEKMREVSDAIFDGAQAFLSRQYRTIATLAVVTAIVIGILLAFLAGLSGGDVGGLSAGEFALRAAISFLFGAFCSGVAGYIGMNVAVRSNIRTASAAQRGVGDALLVSFRGGAVTGFLVIALSLLGVTLVYIVFGGFSQLALVSTRRFRRPPVLWASASALSFVALFAQLGGGIYTKAATWAPTLSARSRRVFPKTIPATRPSSLTLSVTMWATALAVAPTSSSRPPPRTSAR